MKVVIGHGNAIDLSLFSNCTIGNVIATNNLIQVSKHLMNRFKSLTTIFVPMSCYSTQAKLFLNMIDSCYSIGHIS